MTLQQWLIAQVRAGMAEKGWLQSDLAYRAQISEKHLSQMLLGKACGSFGLWDRLLLMVDRHHFGPPA